MPTKTVTRKRLVPYLDQYLKVDTIPDDSLNGLQVEGGARIGRIAFAVDACAQTIAAAARMRADMLIVHHGLLWGRGERLTGVMHHRIAALLRSGISLYAVHLPLDCHEEVGNNAELARLLDFRVSSKFALYKGTSIGVIAEPSRPVPLARVVGRLESRLETKATVLPFGPPTVRRAGIVSGGADFAVGEAIKLECDTFVTGETSHVAFHFAKEGKITIIYAGHYASETVGLKALAAHLRAQFGITCTFLTAPTGF